MKILELTNYSAGICGVWQRVKQESLLLSKDHEVKIFSSNLTKGSDEIARSEEKLGKILIRRFPARKLGGESFMNWKFEQEAIDFKPDIIIAHSYRHLHTTKALKIAGKINCRVFLVTHAPFARKRGLLQNLIVGLYDYFIGRKTINKFDRVLYIADWENKYLKKLGCKKSKTFYLPNGIPDQFFKQSKAKEQNTILFLGRISPIKDIETSIMAMSKIKNKNIGLEIVGPRESIYFLNLKNLIKEKGLENRIRFLAPIYNIKQKIIQIDSCKIFVLPSKSEGMPQSLIEAMARGKIVIASDNPGNKELIENKKNGFLFKVGDENDLANNIDKALLTSQSKIRKQAKKSVEKFSWQKIIKSYNNLF